MKKTTNLEFGGRPQHKFNLFHKISSSWVKIKLYTKNQPPRLLNYGDSYKEDLKIGIWKTTSKYFQFYSQYFV